VLFYTKYIYKNVSRSIKETLHDWRVLYFEWKA